MAGDVRTVATTDIAYLQHGGTKLMMRVVAPEGEGPFPAVIDLHPGVWTRGDSTGCRERDAALAEAGIVAAAIDFRQAGDGYPSSLADINYAIRWFKARAGEFGADPGRIGLCGQSSGGHLAMLAAMRPDDPRYAAIPLDGGAEFDASVRCVGMCWPVINPLSRYRHALRARARAETPAWVADLPECHDRYWGTEAAMAEGNPTLALERGEAVATPPALWVQGRPDEVHDYLDLDGGARLNEPERFAAGYRAAGGEIEVLYIDQATRYSPTSFDPLARFFNRHLGG
ncbi:MAG: alpha/beta hydrolase [Defluviicoccus sp.]|nr:alpha/beta hydrolase [Defluviicoccus sp.]MDE0386760.1 alpha/beta hydrolase [Defluviicoccus sp.]